MPGVWSRVVHLFVAAREMGAFSTDLPLGEML